MKSIFYIFNCIILALALSSPAFALDTFREVLMQNAAAGTGNGTSITVDYFTTASLEVTITGTATITWEESVSGINSTVWNTGVCVNANAPGTVVTTATATGLYHCSLAALTKFRARISSYASGTVTVFARITQFNFKDMTISSSSGGGGGASAVDNSVFTGGTTSVAPMGALYDTTPPAITDGNIGAPRMDTNRYLFVDCVVGCAGGASTPTDAFANPTTAGLSMGFNMGWNGATWDRLQVDGSKFLKVAQQGNITLSNAFLLDATFTGRFSAAYADADAIANQTTTAMHGQLYGYNGATWDRLRATTANGLAVDVTRVQGTVTVSGTVTTTPPANASENVAQFGGTNVSTGTGAGGAGIPRVTISNDSSLAANQSVNVNQYGGSSVTLGQKTMANSEPVVIASDQSPLSVNLSIPSTAIQSYVGFSPISTTFLSSSTTRLTYFIMNLATSPLCVSHAATAQLNTCTAIVKPGERWAVLDTYRGPVSGRWFANGIGEAVITDMPGG